MFERRVYIVLGILVVAAVGLVGRAAQVQLAQAAQWRQVASETTRRTSLIETTRGSILDVKGRVLAEDETCLDASVKYWFIIEEPDEQRLYRDVARKIAREQNPDYMQLSRSQQHELVLAAMPEARQRLEDMWNTLAEIGGVSREEIEATRRQIVERVNHRRRQVVMSRYQRAMLEHEQQDTSRWWRRWVMGEADAAPEMEKFEEAIAEEQQEHVILSDLSPEAYNRLRKAQEHLPGLELTTSRTRRYPFANYTAHVVGQLNAVTREDLEEDPEFGNELRAYLHRDLIGRGGIELIAERQLRGWRGRLDRDLESGQQSISRDREPGADVRTTIDAALQRDIRLAFEHVKFEWPDEGDGLGKLPPVVGPAPGAAVVIDVRTGAIRALVSAPDYDPNSPQRHLLGLDDINRPFINRATQFSAVAGSTIKPIIGLAGVAEGLIGPTDTIECDGFLRIGRTVFESSFRCWTESMFPGQGINRHQNGRDPHPSAAVTPHLLRSPGHLNLADALQRSCNIYFESLAYQLGEERINQWLTSFGLGVPTGSGLPEQRGLIPADMTQAHRDNSDEYRGQIIMSGIGQGHVQATPLQLANVAATLARGGTFIRPTLIEEDTARALAEKRDLGLDPVALELVREGMKAVVTTRGGSGHDVNATLPVVIAAKTGSAQAPPLRVPVRDGQGLMVRDEHDRLQFRLLEHSTREYTNPEAPWYRRINRLSDKDPRQSHAWFIGFAPADDPQIAFAVFVEYGGSGGTSAGSVVTQVMDALVEHGYLQPTREAIGELLYATD